MIEGAQPYERVREVVEANGGSIVGEEYFPLDHMDYAATVERINSSGADVVFNTIVPPGAAPFFEQLYDSGFTSRGGLLVCTYFDENFLSMVPATHVEGCTAASTTTGPSAIRSARGCSRSTTRSIPALRSSPVAAHVRASTAGCACGRPPWWKRARSCRTT